MMPSPSNIRHVGWPRYLHILLEWVAAVLRDLVWRTETRSAEITFGLIAVGWWAVLAHSETFTAGNLYDYLAAVAPQQTWAAGMAALGFCQIGIGLLPQCALRWLRGLVWVASTSVWSYIAWVSLLAVPVTTAASVYAVMAVGSCWAFLRAVERDPEP